MVFKKVFLNKKRFPGFFVLFLRFRAWKKTCIFWKVFAFWPLQCLSDHSQTFGVCRLHFCEHSWRTKNWPPPQTIFFLWLPKKSVVSKLGLWTKKSTIVLKIGRRIRLMFRLCSWWKDWVTSWQAPPTKPTDMKRYSRINSEAIRWMLSGNVAENMRVFLSLLPGISGFLTSRLMSSLKPMSSILSASSRMRYLTANRLTIPRSMKSRRRPGVAIKMLHPSWRWNHFLKGSDVDPEA